MFEVFNIEIENITLLNIVIAIFSLLLGMLIYKVTVAKKLKEHTIVKKQAETDPLTGSGNRHRFVKDIDNTINKKKKFAICFMDLDGFKNVNDTLGHDAGDILLIELSKRLKINLPRSCQSYRLGGDEFAIIIEKINTIDEITKILDDLKQALEKPVIIDNNKITLGYSLGVSIYPTDTIDRKNLMTYADDAMYYIKENGKNNYYFFNDVLKTRLENKKKMQKDLKKAFESDEFSVCFQNRVCINNTDKIILEALIYWNHPVLGRLDAEYFIKDAEEMGVIAKIDEFVFNTVCNKLKEFINKGYNNISFAINISNMHTQRKDFIDKLCESLEEYNFGKGKLQIELNDDIPVGKISGYKYFIDRLKEYDIAVSAPSYNVQYDNLMIFKSLDVDEIKINSKFAGLDSNFDKKVLSDIVNLSKNLKYETSIVSIENERELVSAVLAGADYIQGDYVFERINEDKIVDFAEKYNSLKSNIVEKIKDIKGER